jgi:predicted ATPase
LQCGYGNSPTSRFCGSCGSALGITAATWMEWPHFEEISVSELSADETGALVTELIGSHPELNEIRRRVILRSSGNPFFAEELVRSLEENCEVVGEIGDYRLGTTIAEGVLPATVEAVIGARIAFL